MNQILISISLITAAFLSLSAADVHAGERWSSTTAISWLYPRTDGLAFKTKDYSDKSSSTCDDGRRFMVDIEHENYQVMSSALMTAFAAGKRIKFYYTEGLRQCTVPIIRFYLYE